MAKIIENQKGRRLIKLSPDDVICMVREYQNLTKYTHEYEDIRKILSKNTLYLPEEC